MAKTEKKETIDNIHMGLINLQSQLKPVLKNSEVSYGKTKFKFCDLAGIWDGIRETLTDCGFYLLQNPTVVDNVQYLETILGYKDGNCFKSMVLLPVCSDMKQFGANLTYLRRYTLSSMLGIVADDDIDAVHGDKAYVIDADQLKELYSLLAQDSNLDKAVRSRLKKNGINELSMIQKDMYPTIYKYIVDQLEKVNSKVTDLKAMEN